MRQPRTARPSVRRRSMSATLADQFQRDAAKHIEDAKAIARRAEHQGRDFSPAERAEVKSHVEEAHRLSVKLGQARADNDLLGRIADFDREVYGKAGGARSAASSMPGP